MPSRIGQTLGAVVALAVATSPSVARAEDDIRISIISGKAQITLEGTDLAVFDGDSGERVAFGKGKTKVVTRRAGGGVKVSGDGLTQEGELTAGKLIFEAGSSGVRADGRLFLGRISIVPDGQRAVAAINRVPMETYLLGIVGAEMSPLWPIEALKAQAVAARTYALQRRMMMRAANKPYDLESTVLSQVYLGAERISPPVVEAVSATRGEVLGYKHRLVEALFHSTCGGRTTSARQVFGRDIDYLTSQPCPWCADSNNYRWKISLPLAQIGERLKSAGIVGAKLTGLDRPGGKGAVKLALGKREASISAKALRAAVGYSVILSEQFVARTRGKEVELEGKGFGHGVGMCQWGARGQAAAGWSYKEILTHYYKGARVMRAY